MDPRTSTSSLMDVTQQILLVKSFLSQPTSTHLSFSSNPCCLTRDPYECNLTVVLGSGSPYRGLVSIISGYLCPGHTHTLSVVLLKDAGTHAHKNVDSPSTYPVVQELTSFCSSKPKEASPTYSHGPRNGVHFPLPHL